MAIRGPVVFTCRWGWPHSAHIFTQQIPILDHTNLDSYPNNTIVRYTGMVRTHLESMVPLAVHAHRSHQPQVQDLLNPEFFVSRFRNPGGQWVSTNFTDTLPEQLTPNAEREFAERRVAYCTVPPGTAPWAFPAQNDTIVGTIDGGRGLGGAAKRAREDVDMGDLEDAHDNGQGSEEGKRPAVDDKVGTTRDTAPTAQPGIAPTSTPAPGDCMLFVRRGGRTLVSYNNVSLFSFPLCVDTQRYPECPPVSTNTITNTYIQLPFSLPFLCQFICQSISSI